MTVRRLWQRHERTPVCNLTIRGLHTFAVGEVQVLVHNTTGTGGRHPDAIKGEELKASIDALKERCRQAMEQHLNPELIEDINRSIYILQNQLDKLFFIK